MRKSKYYGNITEYRKVLEKRYKRKETVEKYISIQKLKNKEYTKFSNQNKKYKKAVSKIPKSKRTNEKIEELKFKYFSTSKFSKVKNKKTGFEILEKINRTNVNEIIINLTGDIQNDLTQIYNEYIKDRKDFKHIVLTIHGISTYSLKHGLKEAHFSDSYNKINFERALNDVENTIDELVLINMEGRASGENFNINSITARIIYANS